MKVTADYGKKLGNNKVKCLLCPAQCILSEGQTGICGSRFNSNGKLMTDNYGETVSACYDPIEKKPLYHFYPGSMIFSTGANGCNFGCDNCQNWQIAQAKAPTQFISPENLAELAGRENSIGVAYTYTEPLIWFEYIKASSKIIRKAGLKNVLVTNGYINREPLKELLPYIDAANIDLKGMQPKFYKKVCKGRLEPVLDTIKRFFEAGVKIEITNLIITDLNDTREDFEQLTDFVAGISTHIPLHFSAYFPTYKMKNSPTSSKTLLFAYEIARKKLDYVYLGNVRIPERSNTYCPGCGEKLISREGYLTNVTSLNKGKCANCGYTTNIIQATLKNQYNKT